MSKSPLYTQFETDTKLEQEGIVLDVGLNNSKDKPIAFRLARAGGSNQKFSRMALLKLRPLQRLGDDVPPETMKRIMRELYAHAVVLGWENVEDEDGNDIEFSPEACQELFTKLPDVFALVQKEADRQANYRKHVQEIETGN